MYKAAATTTSAELLANIPDSWRATDDDDAAIDYPRAALLAYPDHNANYPPDGRGGGGGEGIRLLHISNARE